MQALLRMNNVRPPDALQVPVTTRNAEVIEQRRQAQGTKPGQTLLNGVMIETTALLTMIATLGLRPNAVHVEMNGTKPVTIISFTSTGAWFPDDVGSWISRQLAANWRAQIHMNGEPGNGSEPMVSISLIGKTRCQTGVEPFDLVELLAPAADPAPAS